MHYLPRSHKLPEWNRRRFLQSTASLPLLPLLEDQVQGIVRTRVVLPESPFQLGVASGDPAPDGFVIWTRLAPKPLEGGGMPAENVQVQWQVYADEGLTRVVKKGSSVATPALGHSIHVEVEGLKPDRWYWYRFRTGTETSPVGRSRTMPAHDTMPAKLRFAFVSCQHFEHGYFTALGHMAKKDLDLVVHLGDYIYEYAGYDNRVRKHSGPEITELVHYRNRLAQYRTDADLQAAHARCPWLVTWDDHEFDNNCANAISEEAGVAVDAYLRRRANAYQAYYEHMPLRRRSVPRGPDMLLYRGVQFGRLADFDVLDTRQYRTDQPNGDGNKPLEGKVFDKTATLLGDIQEKWLTSRLQDSPCRWNILAQQVMMARVDRTPGEPRNYSMDQWAGYDVPRTRLLQFLQDRQVSNPVVLTGDIHKNWVNDLKIDFNRPEQPTVATEFVGTSITSGGDGMEKTPDHAGVVAENPFVRFYNGERGYVECTVTPKQWHSDYQVVPYVTRPGAPLVRRARFTIQNGRPGATRTG
jgi:alkaline phosphatase D